MSVTFDPSGDRKAFDRLMCYVIKNIPDYTYNYNDFQIYENNDIVSFVWSSNFPVKEPTSEDLNDITVKEIEEYKKRESVKCWVNVVSNKKYLVNASQGSLAVIDGELHVFIKDVWKPI